MLARRARLACAFRPASPSLGGGPEETIYLANAQNKHMDTMATVTDDRDVLVCDLVHGHGVMDMDMHA